MGAHFDRFAKDLFQEAFAAVGEVRVEVEVSVEPQRIDVLLVPSPRGEEARRALGLLGRMGEGPCLFEIFRRTPEVERVRECVRKHLNQWHAWARRGARAERPTLWVLSTGRPVGAMEVFGLAALPEWPAGVYAASPGLGLRVVVIAELPRERATLLLRLLGAGETQRQAMEELRALPVDAWERRCAAPLLVRLRRQVIRRQTARRSGDDQEFIVNTQEWYEEIKQEMREELWAERLPRLFARRLGRALSRAEARRLKQRIAKLGGEAVEDRLFEGTRADLLRWLTAPLDDAG